MNKIIFGFFLIMELVYATNSSQIVKLNSNQTYASISIERNITTYINVAYEAESTCFRSTRRIDEFCYNTCTNDCERCISYWDEPYSCTETKYRNVKGPDKLKSINIQLELSKDLINQRAEIESELSISESGELILKVLNSNLHQRFYLFKSELDKYILSGTWGDILTRDEAVLQQAVTAKSSLINGKEDLIISIPEDLHSKYKLDLYISNRQMIGAFEQGSNSSSMIYYLGKLNGHVFYTLGDNLEFVTRNNRNLNSCVKSRGESCSVTIELQINIENSSNMGVVPDSGLLSKIYPEILYNPKKVAIPVRFY